MSEARSLRTTYLGQFEAETAEMVVRSLEERGIAWTLKQSGRIARYLFMGEWGVRLFVDAARVEEARTIVVELGRTGRDEGSGETT